MSRQCKPFSWMGVDERAIRKKFENLSPLEAAGRVRFQWDTSARSRYYNDEAPSEFLLECGLFSCEPYEFKGMLDGAHNFLSFADLDENNYFRLLGLLDRGCPVSPPAFKQTPDGKLQKYDGFHRTALALACNCRIFFFSVLHARPPFVREERPSGFCN